MDGKNYLSNTKNSVNRKFRQWAYPGACKGAVLVQTYFRQPSTQDTAANRIREWCEKAWDWTEPLLVNPETGLELSMVRMYIILPNFEWKRMSAAEARFVVNADRRENPYGYTMLQEEPGVIYLGREELGECDIWWDEPYFAKFGESGPGFDPNDVSHRCASLYFPFWYGVTNPSQRSCQQVS